MMKFFTHLRPCNANRANSFDEGAKHQRGEEGRGGGG